MRKKLSTVTLLLCAGIFSHAQNYNPSPIPCTKVSPGSMNNFNGTINANCIVDDNNTTNDININGNQNVELKAGEEINLNGEVWIHPNTNGNFYAHIEPSEIGLAWYQPYDTPGSVLKFDKVEIGIDLPDAVNQKIQNYITNSGLLKLNPFNPEQIDVKAEFYRNTNANGNGTWQGPLTVFGFYYEEFFENVADATPANWTLDAVNTQHKFRVRFAPPQIGLWRCKITITINQNTVFNASEFTFNAIQSANPGYVKVSSNNHYFTLGNETYFPIGRNIPQPDMTITSIWNSIYDIHNYDQNISGFDQRKINPLFHKAYRDELSFYKDAGGDYFRTIMFADWYEIEYEKLNNYYDRMNTSWEFDRLIEHCESIGLKIHLSLQNFEIGQILGDYTKIWSWSSPAELAANPNNVFDCIVNPTSTVGYCYNTELGLANPEEFLTDETAWKYYQFRLRYIMARWGYSTSIAVTELMNEVNNVAIDQILDNSSNCNARNVVTDPYVEFGTSYLTKVYDWQKEMCRYLKTEFYNPHLTSVDYAGCPRDVDGVQAIQQGDLSFYSNYVDVATYSHYESFWSKFKSMAINSNDLTWSDGIFNEKAPIINKPLMVAETGDGDADQCDNGISYVKDLWVSSFTGLAGSAMNWMYQHQFDKIQYHSILKDFLYDINLGDAGISWTPAHEERNDHKASVYSLRSNENQVRVIGILDNQTVNQFTKGDNHCDYDLSEILDEDYQFENALSISPGILGNTLSVWQMGNKKKYIIDYYNVITGSLISTETKKSKSNGELKLDFPDLGTDFTDNGFLIAFKIRKYGEPTFITLHDTLYAMQEEENFMEAAETLAPLNITEWDKFNFTSELLQVEISPNPVVEKLTVSIKTDLPSDYKLSLNDIRGDRLQSMEFTSGIAIFDMTSYAKGVYYIILESGQQKMLKKIVKL